MGNYERPIATTLSGSLSWGNFGKFNRVSRITSESFAGTFFATGSNAGVGAFIRTGTSTGNVTMSVGSGDAIPLNELTSGELYEFGPEKFVVQSGSLLLLYPKT
jgi:hypothetical protein